MAAPSGSDPGTSLQSSAAAQNRAWAITSEQSNVIESILTDTAPQAPAPGAVAATTSSKSSSATRA